MTKKNWFKNKLTGEVFYREGYTKLDSMILRDRERKIHVIEKHSVKNYEPVNVTGFPPLKPKEEKLNAFKIDPSPTKCGWGTLDTRTGVVTMADGSGRWQLGTEAPFEKRYITSDIWQDGTAYIVEVSKNVYEAVMVDGSRKKCSAVMDHPERLEKWLKEGSWKIITEAQAMSRVPPKPPFSLDGLYRSERGEFWLHEHGDCFVFRQHGSEVHEIRSIGFVRDLYDRGVAYEVPINKAAEPKKKEFVNGLTYRSVIDGSFYEPTKAHGGVYLRRGFWNTYVGLWEMRFLLNHGQIVLPEDFVSVTAAKQPAPGSCQGYGGGTRMSMTELDIPKMLKPKKKILVEWLIKVKAYNGKDWYTRFYPEGTGPTGEYKGQKPFKTGRTIEVDG